MMKIENYRLTIIMVITDSSIDSSMDTKARGLKCHEKQDVHMVSKNLYIRHLLIKKKKNCNFEKTVRHHHNQVQIQHHW